MVHKKGRCGLNSGATIRMSGFGKLRGRLAAEQHCVVVSKEPARKPNILTKNKRVIDLQDKVNIDDGNLVPHSPYDTFYTINKRKRWTIADDFSIEFYIDEHAEDASRVVLVKREAMISRHKRPEMKVLESKQTDCTSRHDSKGVQRHTYPNAKSGATCATDLEDKALRYDTAAFRKMAKCPQRNIHNQHARGVQRRLHHPEGGYSHAKREAIKEQVRKWEDEHRSKLEDNFDTIKYEIMEPKKISAEQHKWLHSHAVSCRTDEKNQYSSCTRRLKDRQQIQFTEYLSDLTRIEQSSHVAYDKYTDSYYDCDEYEEDNWEENEYPYYEDEEEDIYSASARPQQTMGEELFDLISNAKQKKWLKCEEKSAVSFDGVFVDANAEDKHERKLDMDLNAVNDSSDILPKASRRVHPNPLMGPCKWYPQGRAIYPEEKKRNLSGNSNDSGIDVGSDEVKDKEIVESYVYQPPVCASCAVPFSDIQPSTLLDTYGDDFLEGESRPRKFTVKIPGSSVRVTSAEIFVIFEVADDTLDLKSWNELDDFFIDVKFHVVGNYKESATAAINRKVKDTFEEGKQVKLAAAIETVTDILRTDHIDSFPQPTPSEKKTKAGSQKCSFNSLNEVNRWQQDILDHDTSFAIVDQHFASSAETSKEISNSQPDELDICGVCYESVTGDVCLATSLKTCGHVFCNDCWLNHLMSRVKQGDLGITCPGFKCKVLVDRATLMSLLPWRYYQTHIQHVRDGAIDRRSDLSWCPWDKCDRVVLSRSWKKDGVQNVKCDCGDVWCFNCQERPHWPATCKQAAEYTKQLHKNGDDIPAVRVEPEMIVGKRCPNCLHPLKQYGTSCPKWARVFCIWCRTVFCWRCGKAHDSKQKWPCSPVENEVFDLIDHFPGRKRFYLLATRARRKRLTESGLCRGYLLKKMPSQPRFHLMRYFRKSPLYSESKALWNEFVYTVEYSNVVMYFANRRVRSHTISSSLSIIDALMEELKDQVTLYVSGQCSLKEYSRRLEGTKGRGMIVLRHLKVKLDHQQASIRQSKK